MRTYCIFWSEFGNNYFENYTRTIVKAETMLKAVYEVERKTSVFSVVRYVFDITEYV
jgi:hypothetical protein